LSFRVLARVVLDSELAFALAAASRELGSALLDPILVGDRMPPSATPLARPAHAFRGLEVAQ
jgi:hypothetical protein